MKDLIKKIKAFENESQTLEIPIAQRGILIEKVKQFTDDFIEALPEAESFNTKTPNFDKLKIRDNSTKTLDDILSIFKEEVNELGLRAASGGHVGYIPGGGIYAAALGDFLAAVSNEYAGVSYASPGAVAIENEVITWLKKVFSFPETAVGNLASGGSIANLIALTAARDKHKIKNEHITKSVVYLSEQAHHCLKKALRIIGLEDVIIRHLELDEDYKIDTGTLNKQIEVDFSLGLHPFLIIASAGTTDVGAIDPLEKIATIAKHHNLWYHIDAAYGGFFVLTSKKESFKGIEKADSLVVDPHKGMFLPYGLGAVLIKDGEAVLHSHRSTGNYLQDAVTADLANEPANVSPELTKHFRGLRMWLPLQLHGIKPFVAALEEKLLLTTYFRKKLIAMGCKVGPKPDLSVSYFWYPTEKHQNDFNKKLMQNIHQDGSVFLSSTILKGEFVIRIAILSFRTKRVTIDRALEMIERSLKQTLVDFE
ncbi:MAG TPA: aminotransferase class V-fold PLP-dependent enzyme [Flavobacteriaceae bacterium]|nr:aminotransferase class V-fold PLP-dependent enzyme [Flavobacteriaceae bacterium]